MLTNFPQTKLGPVIVVLADLVADDSEQFVDHFLQSCFILDVDRSDHSTQQAIVESRMKRKIRTEVGKYVFSQVDPQLLLDHPFAIRKILVGVFVCFFQLPHKIGIDFFWLNAVNHTGLSITGNMVELLKIDLFKATDSNHVLPTLNDQTMLNSLISSTGQHFNYGKLL